eukprot:gnl/TRDRNA2_/TRDRNA2_156671_c0_seq1.p1 gnl/TRDRNA2_/TRDRNA2_156671_c0~~gnl/TRDRNA2_/TRDRNA2_156671_c0_seq1.p1  ORF type:complete len:859 (-),score=111.52 gnl/TRDRNA2_/TRDRNA2_156671_c0_seq1:92-2635(-)
MVGVRDTVVPPELAGYAERLYERFPEVLLTLGNPSLPDVFHIPPCGNGCVQIRESGGCQVVEVELRHHGVPQALAPWTAASTSCIGPASYAGQLGVPAGMPSYWSHAVPDVQPCSASRAAHFPQDRDTNPAVTPPPMLQVPQPMLQVPGLPGASEIAAKARAAEEPESPRSPGSYKPWKEDKGSRAASGEVVQRRSALKKSMPAHHATAPSKSSSSTGGAQSGDRILLRGYPGAAPEPPRRNASLVSLMEDDDSCSGTAWSDYYDSPNDSLSPGPRQAMISRFAQHRPSTPPSDSSGGSSHPSSAAFMGTLSGHSSSVSPHNSSREIYRPASTPTSGSLQNRRGLSLCLEAPSDERSGNRPKTGFEKQARGRSRVMKSAAPYLSGHSCHSPENKQPKVQLLVHPSKLDPVISPALLPVGRDEDEQASSHQKESKERRRWSQEKVMPVPPSPFAAPLQRPLPGAFPNRRTVIFFDWDDTLCPTSWIRSVLKSHMEDSKTWAEGDENVVNMDYYYGIPEWFGQPLPDDDFVVDAIDECQKAAIEAVEVAQALGVVVIVTNAVPGWVEKTIKKWLPQMKQYIHGHGARAPIKVIYGQRCYKRDSHELENMPFVDELGEHMWWKKSAMSIALDKVEELYRLAESRRTWSQPLPNVSWCASAEGKKLWSVVSIGDNEAEMQAAEIASCNHTLQHPSRRYRKPPPPSSDGGTSQEVCTAAVRSRGREDKHADELGSTKSRRRPPPSCDPALGPHRPRWPWVKLLKFKECPHVRQLCCELEEITDLLPTVVSMHRHVRLDLENYLDNKVRVSDPLLTPTTPRCEKVANIHAKLMAGLDCQDELALEKHLRAQVV